jgi:hypothetical protein
MAEQDSPGRGLLGWLGRQVGYVKRAIKTDVGGPRVVYRNDTVEEMPHPADQNVKLRRHVIDEVIVESKTSRPGGGGQNQAH